MSEVEGEGEVLGAVNSAWDTARAIEPAPGEVTAEDGDAVRAAIAAMAAALDGGLATLTEGERAEVAATATAAYARSAAVALAAGDEATARAWLEAALGHCADGDQRAILAAAAGAPDRYRALVHARYLQASGDDDGARALYQDLAVADDQDAIARVALRKLDDDPAPPPPAPPPLLRERSRLATFAQLGVLVVIVLGLVGAGVYAYLTDSNRLARKRFDAVLAAAGGADADAALARLEAAMAGPDLARVDGGRRERAGAAIVRLAADRVPMPFTVASLDQAIRVVRRYQALPPAAQGGAARAALLARLDAWIAEAGNPEAELVLMHEAVGLARASQDHVRVAELDARISAARVALAAARADAGPLDALGLLLDGPPDPATTAAASKLIARVVDAPSLLDDARFDLEAWLRAVPGDDPLRARVIAARDRGAAGRAEAEAVDVTPKALAAMQVARPWDQRVALALASAELEAGKLDEAAARLRAFGPPGLLIRDARFTLGHIAAAQDRLDEADQLLTALLATRVARFAAASAALEAAARAAEGRLGERLEAGDVPADLRAQVEAPSATDDERRAAVSAWAAQEVEADADVVARRPAFQALSDVVPVSLTLGSVKLRRAQKLTGPARDAMLHEAERTFLAIRTQAEGQPEFQLGLGEIYARLGKAEESEAEFEALLARGVPMISLAVARVYRELGSIERARQIATDLAGRAPSPVREQAAIMLALLATSEDEAEAWYRKADADDPFVRVSLLQLEATRLRRQGKDEACAAKYAEAAAAHLAMASAASPSGYNNAALAHQRGYECSGDPEALRAAAASLERAYRASGDSALVVANLEALLAAQARLRALGRRVDVRALRLTPEDAEQLVATLAQGPERAALLADLTGDAAWRRSNELLTQAQVLSPSNTDGYEEAFARAQLQRDATGAAAVLARMKQARALDTSRAAEQRARWIAGELDAKMREHFTSNIIRLDALAARPTLDARTRAAALMLAGYTRMMRSTVDLDAATTARARADLIGAMTAWPALDLNHAVITSLIDEAALAADAGRWGPLRRTRTPVGALTELADAGDPLAATIRASAPWAQVAALARARERPPGVDDLRLARLLGDPALAARAAAAREDPFVRLALELDLLADPTDPTTALNLALLDAP